MPSIVGRLAALPHGVDLARGDARGLVFRREENLEGLPQRLGLGVSKQLFRATIPAGDATLVVDEHDGVVADVRERRVHVISKARVTSRVAGLDACWGWPFRWLGHRPGIETHRRVAPSPTARQLGQSRTRRDL